jgi:hypothetical protein
LKLGSNKGHFTLDAETVFRPHLAKRSSEVTQTSHLALSAHAPKPVLVWWKSVSNKGQFTVEAETVFRPYLAWHYSEESQTLYMARPPHAP